MVKKDKVINSKAYGTEANYYLGFMQFWTGITPAVYRHLSNLMFGNKF
jgi:hypothetical protein